MTGSPYSCLTTEPALKVSTLSQKLKRFQVMSLKGSGVALRVRIEPLPPRPPEGVLRCAMKYGN